MKFFVTGVGGQLGHDVMNELLKRGYEGVGSDIQPEYSGVDDGSPVTKADYVQLDITDKAAVEKASEIVMEKGARKAVMLNVSGPFHTSLLAPASEKLNAELQHMTIKDMNIPVITNLTADVVPSKDEVIDILTKQVMNPVKWEQSVRKMIELGVDTFVEMGPGKTLSSFVKKISKDVAVYNVEDLKSLEKTCGGLGC